MNSQAGPLRVLISPPMGREYQDMVRAVSPRVVLDFADDEGEQRRKLGECEVLVTYDIPADTGGAPELRWVQSLGVGVDQVLGTPFMTSDVALTTPRGILSITVAEFAFATLLALCRRVPYLLGLQRNREWVSWWDVTGEVLHGRTMGILGYGSIGRCVARIAWGFGMRVLALKRDPGQKAHSGYHMPGTGDPEGALPERFYGLPDISEMLRESDAVVLTLPLTGETHHIMGGPQLAAMKPSAYLVNVGRGQLVDEPALTEALSEGRIAGAALDVFETEPLSKASKLYQMDNVIVTPHCASLEGSAELQLWRFFCENLRRYLAGQPLMNEVDKSVGY